MKTLRQLLLIVAIRAAPVALHAQEFKIFNQSFQVHGFVSQGFVDTNQNNWLSMKTSDGSLAMTDAAVNISTQITDKFRVGAQLYDRNVGQLGKWHPQLDWAYGDYRFASWFGVRAGKVKTVMGLYNDTQDMEFLHTWAILPQSMYPVDLRASTIAHEGVDVYGTVKLKKMGELSYTGYVGKRPFDAYGGYVYGLKSQGATLTSMPTRLAGGDLRWANLVKGLVFGASFMNAPATIKGTMQYGPYVLPFDVNIIADNYTTFYTQYKVGKLTLDGQYRRETAAGTTSVSPPWFEDERGWYASASYRLMKRLEVGTYHSRFYPVWGQPSSPPANHMFDQAVTARVDLKRYWDVKVEGHFMDGYGNPISFRGFYPQDNPQGLKPKTNALVIRTGFNF